MGRGTTLAALRQMVKAELGNVLTAGVATAEDPTINALLSSKQQWLATQFDWPFLRVTRDIPLLKNQRYYPWPADLATERPLTGQIYWAERFSPVEYGIDWRCWNISNPDRDREDPVRRWQLADVGAGVQCEVWPVPAGAQSLRLTGFKTVAALANDADKAELDDVLMVLFVAAELLSRRKGGDAGAKLALAQSHMARLKAQSAQPSAMFVLGGGGMHGEAARRQKGTVAISYPAA